MDLLREIRDAIQETALAFTLHAQEQMTARRIKVQEIRAALLSSSADVIEDYPGDPRGPSCLVRCQR